jgi:geranylgeranylglycerol-phosphate geranylgeranyltransferase
MPDTEVPLAPSASSPPPPRLSLRSALRLMRVEKPLCATLFCFLGAWLAAPAAVMTTAPVLVGAASVFCICAFGFIINDWCDLRVDSLGKAHRPLPAGEVSAAAAWRLAWLMAAAGLALGFALGPGPGAIAAGALTLSFLYSWRLKSTLLVGNLSVAIVVAMVLIFGAVVASGGTPATVWTAAAVTSSYILAQEVLFTLEDETEDRAAGLTTTATILGPARTGWLVRALLLLFGAVALAPWFAGPAGIGYLTTLAALVLLPIAVVWVRLRAPLQARHVAQSVVLSRAVWVTSFVPLALLK